MKTPPLFFALLLTGLVLTGCSPRNAELLGVHGPRTLQTGEEGAFEAEIVENAKTPVEYRWDFGDAQMGEGASTAHVFEDPGAYTVLVTVSNRNGRFTTSGSTDVVVTTPPVSAQIVTLLANLYETDTQTPVRFDANVRGDAPLSYRWDFGDNNSSSDTAPMHTFSELGTHTVTLTISNEHGQDTRSVDILVTPFEANYCADLAEMNAVFFDRNASVLTDMGIATLEDNVQILMDCPNLTVRVEAMAGPFERLGQPLSEDRARAVQQYYISNGISSARIQTAGMGQVEGGSKKSGAEQFRRADTIPLQ